MVRRGALGRHIAGLFALAMLGSCGPLVPPAERPPEVVSPPAEPLSALALGVAAGPPIASLGFTPADAASALASFVESCPQLLRREDKSGLTQAEDWRRACDAAATWPRTDAAGFFAANFEAVRIGEGTAFATGYYEPEIAGSRYPVPGYDVPVYGMPTDLERAWPSDMPEAERTGRPPLGRYDETGAFVPYFERSEIEAGALEGRAPVIAWAHDPVEFFFLQIQGSGRLRGPQGEIMRIGYAGQNGRDYVGIGSVMRERGLLGDGPGQYPGSMQGIMQYLREHPVEGQDLMRLNKSWIFFRELTGDGPLGALGVPVRAQSSVAADPQFTPLGAPVFLQLDRQEANGLWIAQDTGGAIKGANRFDTFWGAGDAARVTAGGMSARGQALLLLPLGTLTRLGVR